ncbi:hypothetical protein ARMGADRAFT_1077614 [Armillaria gallica]|uniref:Uncharacterized protein n=1 Tax=Armillaria gallica TaxID=47427 RepID=A0A2H3DPW8_ARMGA|nr:hypothetical protein ARMGADRAFT_1077614 [Armillaria gallica]
MSPIEVRFEQRSSKTIRFDSRSTDGAPQRTFPSSPVLTTWVTDNGVSTAATVQTVDTPWPDYASPIPTKSAAGLARRSVELAASPTTNTHPQGCIQRTTTVTSESREAARMPKEALKTRTVIMEMRSAVVTPRRLRSPGNGVIHIRATPLASFRILAVTCLR